MVPGVPVPVCGGPTPFQHLTLLPGTWTLWGFGRKPLLQRHPPGVRVHLVQEQEPCCGQGLRVCLWSLKYLKKISKVRQDWSRIDIRCGPTSWPVAIKYFWLWPPMTSSLVLCMHAHERIRAPTVRRAPWSVLFSASALLCPTLCYVIMFYCISLKKC